MSERAQAIAAAYESAQARIELSREQFEDAVLSWEVQPVRVRGEIVGAVLMRGPEIHACIKPEGFRRWLSKGVLKRTLFDVMARHGRAVTSVTPGNEVGQRFVESLGFKLIEEKDGVRWYEVKNGN